VQPKIELTKLTREYDVSNFDCGEASQNEFIQREALPYQEERLGVTYIAHMEDKFVGFVTISMADVKTKKMEMNDRLAT